MVSLASRMETGDPGLGQRTEERGFALAILLGGAPFKGISDEEGDMGKIMCLKTCIMVRTISCNPGAPSIQSLSMCVPMCACARVSMWCQKQPGTIKQPMLIYHFWGQAL